MEWIVRAVSEHPLTAMAVCFAVLLIVYFLFKSMIKLALIFFIVIVAVAGYIYFQHPELRPANFKDAVEKVRIGAGNAMDKGKEVYGKRKELLDKGKEAYIKGKELIEKGKIVIDKGIDKGNVAVEKGKETAGGIERLLNGDDKAEDDQKP
jgi:hypothetical protein